MKNFYKLLSLTLLSCIFLLPSCTIDVNINDGSNDNDDDVFSIDRTVETDLGSLGDVVFEYDECDLEEENSESDITVGGITYERVALQTDLSRGNFILRVRPVFLVDESSNQDWDDILDTDINDPDNPNFGLEVEVRRGQRTYRSTSLDTINGQLVFVYTDDFNYEIDADERYESECNDDDLLELSGDISGLLVNTNADGSTDTIEVDIPNFSILYIQE
jgi:hypothetical protein